MKLCSFKIRIDMLSKLEWSIFLESTKDSMFTRLWFFLNFGLLRYIYFIPLNEVKKRIVHSKINCAGYFFDRKKKIIKRKMKLAETTQVFTRLTKKRMSIARRKNRAQRNFLVEPEQATLTVTDGNAQSGR